MKTYKTIASNGYYTDLDYFAIRVLRGRKHYYIDGTGGPKTAFAADLEGDGGWTSGGSRRIKISEKQFWDLMGIDDPNEAHEYVRDMVIASI